MENKRKHLELIQNVITRMASNLFYLKGWAVTLIVGIFALATKGANPEYLPLAYFVAFILWVLDGYFLSQERLFRSLYGHVRKLDEKDIDFSMDTTPFKKEPKNSWVCSMFSVTLLWFYLSLLAVISIMHFI
jgi:hypothetical protein